MRISSSGKHSPFLGNLVLVLLVAFLLVPTCVQADTEAPVTDSETALYTNTETGYEVHLSDWAMLLSTSEEAALVEDMKPITEHGNVAFVSIDDNPAYSSRSYAEGYCESVFGYESATVFLIDMDNRYIWIYSQGDIYNTVTSDYADTITDNVYTYASDADYYRCASKAFEQMNSLLEGKRIAQPMKYICNAFIAVAIALLINYFIVMAVSHSKKASRRELMSGIYNKVDINNARANFTHQSKRYSPQSSGSGGGGSHGGGGGGGGSHGGGGGHRF